MLSQVSAASLQARLDAERRDQKPHHIVSLERRLLRMLQREPTASLAPTNRLGRASWPKRLQRLRRPSSGIEHSSFSGLPPHQGQCQFSSSSSSSARLSPSRLPRTPCKGPRTPPCKARSSPDCRFHGEQGELEVNLCRLPLPKETVTAREMHYASSRLTADGEVAFPGGGQRLVAAWMRSTAVGTGRCREGVFSSRDIMASTVASSPHASGRTVLPDLPATRRQHKPEADGSTSPVQVDHEMVRLMLTAVFWPNALHRSTRLSEDIAHATIEQKSFSLGLVHGCQDDLVCSQYMQDRPTLTRLLAGVSPDIPGFSYTTIQLNRHDTALSAGDIGRVPYERLHLYESSAGRSWIIGFGNYEGGQLWIYDQLGSYLLEVKDRVDRAPCLEQGSRLPGRLEDIRHRWVQFDGRLPHAVMPFSGSAWTSLIYFTVPGWQNAGKVPLEKLEAYGFKLPEAHCQFGSTADWNEAAESHQPSQPDNREGAECIVRKRSSEGRGERSGGGGGRGAGKGGGRTWRKARQAKSGQGGARSAMRKRGRKGGGGRLGGGEGRRAGGGRNPGKGSQAKSGRGGATETLRGASSRLSLVRKRPAGLVKRPAGMVKRPAGLVKRPAGF
eukprot:TRINITY_DN8167_c0_g1_i15.p1 TRINITY_DN8167_c0_g1~~TRINITY_DN8167_c0_g1_i15.p1  ORF type:complete len:614 (+),score=79.81 TRINITY_DN8167_c0_g1_i15:137-1978(+)